MASSPKHPAQGPQRKGPETLLALRESLIEDLRTHQSADQAGEGGAWGTDHEAAAKELPHAPGITPTESPIAPRQTNWLSDGIAGDSPDLTPAKLSADRDLQQLRALRGESSNDGPSFEAEESFGDTHEGPTFTRKSRRVAGSVWIIAILGAALALLALGQDGDLSPNWLSSFFRFATGSSADPNNQTVPTEGYFTSLQRQLNELAGRQGQMAKDVAARLTQLEKTASDFTLVRRQVNELAGKQDQLTRDLATRRDQLKTVASDVAVVRRQIEEVAAKQEQMAGSLTTRQDQLMTTVSDVAVVRRQVDELAAKQEQMAGSIAARGEQLKTVASDFAVVRRRLEDLATKQDQMVGNIASPRDQLKTMVSDFAVVRRQAEELAAKQDQMAEDIAKLQAAERSLSQKIASLSPSRTVRIRRHRKVVTPAN
jgi:uncharacterized protein YoxC